MKKKGRGGGRKKERRKEGREGGKEEGREKNMRKASQLFLHQPPQLIVEHQALKSLLGVWIRLIIYSQ